MLQKKNNYHVFVLITLFFSYYIEVVNSKNAFGGEAMAMISIKKAAQNGQPLQIG
jgi:hypothetical protein